MVTKKRSLGLIVDAAVYDGRRTKDLGKTKKTTSFTITFKSFYLLPKEMVHFCDGIRILDRRFENSMKATRT